MTSNQSIARLCGCSLTALALGLGLCGGASAEVIFNGSFESAVPGISVGAGRQIYHATLSGGDHDV